MFHDDIQDAQVNQTFVDAQGDFIALINNSASASINGVEFDTTVVPISDVQVTGSWTLYQGAIRQFSSCWAMAAAAPRPELGSGEPFPFTPLNRFSLEVRYFLPVPETWGDMSVSGTEYYSTHTILAVAPDPFGQQSAYHQLDLHFDWNQIGGRPVDASLFAT
ncbi:MAG: TonB-dependent receptor, partial [Aliidongia sp.]